MTSMAGALLVPTLLMAQGRSCLHVSPKSVTSDLTGLADTLVGSDTAVVLSVEAVLRYVMQTIQLDSGGSLSVIVAQTNWSDATFVAVALNGCLKRWGFRYAFAGVFADGRALVQWNAVIAELDRQQFSASPDRALALTLLYTAYAIGRPVQSRNATYGVEVTDRWNAQQGPTLSGSVTARVGELWEVSGELALGDGYVFAAQVRENGAIENYFLRARN